METGLIFSRRSKGSSPLEQEDDGECVTTTTSIKPSGNKSSIGSFATQSKMTPVGGLGFLAIILLLLGDEIARLQNLGIMDPVASNAFPSNCKKMIQSNTTSFCLLHKDDDEILNEWIAYHYHVMNMRHLIIALDPTSRNPSPEPMLKKWRNLFGLDIDIWKDEDYMPKFFLEGNYHMAKSFVETFEFANPKLQNDTLELMMVNNHRFRQHTFVSYCMRDFKGRVQDEKQGNWVAHVDTDEYLVINPMVLRKRKSEMLKPVVVPTTPSPGSLLEYANQALENRRALELRRSCVLMPRILYTPRESENITIGDGKVWDVKRFETLRWRVHRNVTVPLGLQKAVMDITAIPWNHSVFAENLIFSPHMPLPSSETDCPGWTSDPKLRLVFRYPLAVNHYIGSLERYLSRNDTRRYESVWRRKEQIDGSEAEAGWLFSWLSSFVQVHGIEKASQVLGDYEMEEFDLN